MSKARRTGQADPWSRGQTPRSGGRRARSTLYLGGARVRWGRSLRPHGLHPWGLLLTEDGVTGERWRLLVYPWPGWGLLLEWGDLHPLNW